jgi:uncharacterized RDD family membrane protein YckC
LLVPRGLLASLVLVNFVDQIRGHHGALLAHGGYVLHAAKVAFPVISGLGILYFVLLNGLGPGQTLGNRALGIAIRDADNGMPIGIARSLVRSLVRTLLYAVLLIPTLTDTSVPILLLWIPGLANDLFPLFNARRQTIADKVARSVMLKAS